ncbi:MAG: hypothetical protein K6U14_10455 [Firmicutes bacterium]|nr:hypothetical protein [Alicyclobacillaceae bacterium]MCL6498031.1 hypothetical protein [Bacillota bacterium]
MPRPKLTDKAWTRRRFAEEVASELGIPLDDHDQPLGRDAVRQDRLTDAGDANSDEDEA